MKCVRLHTIEDEIVNTEKRNATPTRYGRQVRKRQNGRTVLKTIFFQPFLRAHAPQLDSYQADCVRSKRSDKYAPGGLRSSRFFRLFQHRLRC